jgi:hypothetical protein
MDEETEAPAEALEADQATEEEDDAQGDAMQTVRNCY